MKRCLAFLLVIVMLFSLLACSKNKGNDTEESDGATTVSTLPGEQTKYLSTLRQHDDGEKEFRVLVTTQLERFYDQENMSSIVVDNAAYTRNVTVNELFNTKLTFEALDGNASGAAAFTTEISTTTLAGDGSYDLVVGQNYYTLPLVAEGMYHNMKSSNTFNWNAAWYHQSINDGGTINGKLWGASGSFVISQLAYAMACFYSKEVYQMNNFEYDLYELARNGQWTYEIFYELVTAFGDTGDPSTQTYGLIRYDHAAIGTVFGMGVDFVSKDAYGKWTFDEFYTPRFEDIYEKVRSLFNDYPAAMLDTSKVDIARSSIMQRTLFVQLSVDSLLTDDLLKPNGNFTIGILPMPKLDENQANYRTRVMREELFLIPSSADLERSALFTEALNYTTYTIVNTAYWETALELRSSDTTDDMEMLGIIASTVHKDTAQYFNEDLLKVTSQPGLEIMNNSASFSQWWAKNKKALNRKLDNLNLIYG